MTPARLESNFLSVERGASGGKAAATATPALQTRYFALDGLRGSMMLLGVVLHIAISYGTLTTSVWPYQDHQTSPVMDWIYLVIHIFRMPVFFVMAGFFAALLYLRRGRSGMLKNRAMRVGLPFVIAWLLLIPVITAGFNFANGSKAGGIETGWPAVQSWLHEGPIYRDHLAHLWFLYYLLYFYVAAVAIGWVVNWISPRVREGMLNFFRRLLTSRLRVLYFSIPTAAILSLTKVGALDTSFSFIPNPVMLICYCVFFGFGWLVYLVRDELRIFLKSPWLILTIGAGLIPINLAVIVMQISALPQRSTIALLMTAGSGAIITWCCIFGMTGLFMRYLDRPSSTVRYIVDSSYWVYLVHLPVVIWMPGLIANVEVHAMIKALLVMAVAVPILYLSYDICVRPTVIGALLIGRRYERGLPKLDNNGHPVQVRAD